jgi:hypothetical protein
VAGLYQRNTLAYTQKLIQAEKPGLWGKHRRKKQSPMVRRSLLRKKGESRYIKHGFYANYLPEDDLDEAMELPLDALEQDVAALRVVLRRILVVSGKKMTIKESLTLLEVVSRLAAKIGELLKLKMQIDQAGAQGSALYDDFEKAMQGLLEEFQAGTLEFKMYE